MKLMMFLALVLLIAMYLVGCKQDDKVVNGMLTAEGQYSLGTSGNNLEIEIKDGLVQAVVVTESGAVVHRIDERASSYSRWTFYWEEDYSTLWFSSSDVGLFFYRKSSDDNEYIRNVITDKSEETEVPLCFLNVIPNSMKSGLVPRPEKSNEP